MASNIFIQIEINVYKINSFSNQLIITDIVQQHKAFINKPPPSLSLFWHLCSRMLIKLLFENEIKYDLSHLKNGQK
jgi:MarR-like DNA-binding transcriptional regulator SgrR of sgrS sRNA